MTKWLLATSFFISLPALAAPVVATAPIAIVVSPSPTLVEPVPLRPRRDRSRDALLEIGPTLTPATFGIEGGLAVPLTDHLRLGMFGGANQLFDGIGDYATSGALYDGGLELRYSGRGVRHGELGVAGGVVNGPLGDGAAYDGRMRDTAGFAALRLGGVREYADGNLELSVEPMVMFDMLGHGLVPGVMTSLRWQLPL